MRLARPALCLALMGSLAGAGLSQAAVKKAPPVCNLVTDPAGDSAATTGAAVPAGKDQVLDVVSADLAADSKLLTAVIRLEKVAPTASTAPFGYSALYSFVAPSAPDVVLYFRYFSGNEVLPEAFDFGYDGADGLASLGDAFGVVDTAKNEIRISAPLSGFGEQATIKKKDKLSGFDVTTSRDLIALLVYADRATSEATYEVGALSCVKPGK